MYLTMIIETISDFVFKSKVFGYLLIYTSAVCRQFMSFKDLYRSVSVLSADMDIHKSLFNTKIVFLQSGTDS